MKHTNKTRDNKERRKKERKINDAGQTIKAVQSKESSNVQLLSRYDTRCACSEVVSDDS